MNHTNPSRRRFLLNAAFAAATLPLGAHMLSRPVRAQGLPMLPLDNAQAKALAYVETTDGLSHPNFKPGSNCANCQFYTGSDPAAGPCTLFPGFNVAGEGWCSAWAKKA
jgi:hypothetical protein